ncbi:MAG: HipA domain-containing protein [Bacteroidales bacterium]|jgi:serine/threonine-protein kinase HipA|nr:HipA domain-containing protein [Bacteroidales bacterium]MDD3105712.1 HipA domain-containing protein [Bacteroidales bacterium]MDD3550330.1 HipA domain-containing protein [Bacteroidales bacterium]MDD4065258.1 HipA domain-containing protein [Bacteroidales bacterium]MDD4500899.1 HipA domain-containing protein [Bacteroidales bacterium]
MAKRCLYCYQPINEGQDFHEKCSMDFFGVKVPPKIEYSLDQMDELAKHVVERNIAVPGIQPKLSLSLIKKTKKDPETRLTVIGALGGQYIFKPPSEKFPEMPANEHVTMRIAESFGIRTVPSSLIRLASGELSYITKRVDRTKTGEKIHMIDMFQITEAYDKYKSSMEKIGKALHDYSGNTQLDKIFFFDLVLFSFLTGNNDMHLKNFSMIESPSGWVLSPAYDLLNVSIELPEDTEELALTLDGKKKKLKREHFEKFGEGLGLTRVQIIRAFNRMVSNKPKATIWIDNSFLSNTTKAAYHKVIKQRYTQLEL